MRGIEPEQIAAKRHKRHKKGGAGKEFQFHQVDVETSRGGFTASRPSSTIRAMPTAFSDRASEATSLAARLGTTSHRSLLLHRMRVAGLDSPEKLGAEAVRRGLPYYAPPGPAGPATPPAHPVSAADLAIALLHPSLPWQPQRLRLAAATLATRGLVPTEVAHLAVQERAAGIVRAIAAAAAAVEPAETFWAELLAALPETPPIPPGVLPHPSRFMAISGRARPGVTPQSVWVRPTLAA